METLSRASNESVKYNEEMVEKVADCFAIQGELKNHIRQALLSPESVGAKDENEEKAMESLSLATDDGAGIAKCAHLYRQLNASSPEAFACIRKIAEIITKNPKVVENYKDELTKL